MRGITLCAVAMIAGCGGSASSTDAHFAIDQDASVDDLAAVDALEAMDLSDVDLRSPDLAPAFDLAPPAAGCPAISPPACYSTTVQAGRDANLNTELNDWAAAAVELKAAGLAVDDVRMRKIRDSFWAPDDGIYNLFANQAWPGGPLNAHFASLATCGDGSCGATENHLACPADCP